MADIFLQTIDPIEEPKSIEASESNESFEGSSTEEHVTIIEPEMENILDAPSQSLQIMMSEMVELANSEFIHHRQLAVKKLLNCFQVVDTNKEYQQHIIAIMCKLSEDEESLVRSELVQHIPSIALYCQSHSLDLQKVIRQQLVPYTVKLLNDPQILVRKLSQSALLVLLENNLINEAQLTEWICPLVSQLPMCESNLEELRVEDVTMMSHMVQLVNRDIAVEFFLEPYITLCCDPAFAIRRICAMGFGALCNIVGSEITEHSLLPAFLNMCNDERWGVKKACADVFVDVASVVTMKTRMDILSHVFMNLLNDISRYVSYAAYQSLGGFIYTFSLPDATKDEDSIRELNSALAVQSICHPRNRIWNYRKQNAGAYKSVQPSISCQRSVDVSALHSNVENLNDIHEDSFNDFQFWREPLPDIELDIENNCVSKVFSEKVTQNLNSHRIKKVENNESIGYVESRPTQIRRRTFSQNRLLEDYAEDTPDFRNSVITFGIDESVHTKYLPGNELLSLNYFSSELNAARKELISTPYDQNIVPGFLLSKFCLLYDDVESGENKQYGDERVGYCAYNFPAVAKALGREHWPCIRNVCHLLAKDLEWTVRRTVASYLHELAIFLGHDITYNDLLPLFLYLMKDVDEVRIKLVVNMAEFLKCLNPEERAVFLPSIEKFFEVDNERNWRFRWTLAEHMKPVLELYSAQEVIDHFFVLGMVLLTDKFYAVRQSAVQLVASMVCKIYQDEDTRLSLKTFLEKIYFVHFVSNKWRGRQMYIMFAEEIAKQQCIPVDFFMKEIMHDLKDLATDRVPNVRLALCRLIALTLHPLGYLTFECGDSISEMNRSIILQLLKDSDKDVQHFALLLPKIESSSTTDLPDS